MKTFISLAATFCILMMTTCKKSSSDNSSEEQAGDTEITAQVLTQQLVFPWEIVWGPDNMLWITERGGKISRVNPTTGQISPLLTIADAKSQGEGGLLGMALHPDFTTTPQVFVAYNYDKSGTYTEKIVRYTYNGTSLINPVILLDNIPAAGNHNGCRLAISPDLKLYIITGDAAVASQAQNLNSLSGKFCALILMVVFQLITQLQAALYGVMGTGMHRVWCLQTTACTVPSMAIQPTMK